MSTRSQRSTKYSKSNLGPNQSPPPPLQTPAAGPKRAGLSTGEWTVLIGSTLFKLLLFSAYRSTDFEVHRNWLAITHSLPLSRWYYDTTSEWTLDYPPFFAFFERFLSLFAYLVDPKIVQLDNLGYDGWTAVAFQRSSVILSELVLAGALFKWARGSIKPDYPTAFLIAASVLLHPGLIMVDHIHFQYNGMLLGLLLWSLVAAREGNLYACAALFATLLNFKHIFVYLALPFVVFLFRRHCFTPAGFKFDRLVELGLIVASICAISFGPFVLAGGFSQLPQIVSRLFPFQRGLNHAYWAGNVWALVSATDRVLVRYLVHRGWGDSISPQALVSASRGLIGETTFGVLPNVTPKMCFSLTFGFTLVYLSKLWFDPSYKRFLDSVVLSAMTSFLWGWHVHEKAVLLFLVPLSLTAVEDEHHLRTFIVATSAGVYSLFPLLIKSAETPIKLGFSLIWCAVVFPALRKVVYRPNPSILSILVDYAESTYLAGFFLLQLYTGLVHPALFPPPNPAVPGSAVEGDAGAALEFLPLMLTSVYCAVGIVWAWLRLSWAYLVG